MSNNNYKNMSDGELDGLFHEDPSNGEIFEEYIARQKWKTPPEFSSVEEEEQFLSDLISSKTFSK